MLNGPILRGMRRLFLSSNTLIRFQSSGSPKQESNHDETREALYKKIEQLEKKLEDREEEQNGFPSFLEKLAINFLLGSAIGVVLAKPLSMVIAEEANPTAKNDEVADIGIAKRLR